MKKQKQNPKLQGDSAVSKAVKSELTSSDDDKMGGDEDD